MSFFKSRQTSYANILFVAKKKKKRRKEKRKNKRKQRQCVSFPPLWTLANRLATVICHPLQHCFRSKTPYSMIVLSIRLMMASAWNCRSANCLCSLNCSWSFFSSWGLYVDYPNRVFGLVLQDPMNQYGYMSKSLAGCLLRSNDWNLAQT